MNIQDKISFETIELQKGQEYKVQGKQIITVVVGKVLEILTENQLDTFQSSFFLEGNTFQAQEKSFLTVVSLLDENIDEDIVKVGEEYGEYCRTNWTSVYEAYGVLEGTDLYKSPVTDKNFEGINYKFNFWFCGPEVDCGIHNIHDFIEIHTGVLGDGRMEKFQDSTQETLLEKVYMRPGLSHRPFNKVGKKDENGNPIYPFHRWKGGEKGDIWLVIEKY